MLLSKAVCKPRTLTCRAVSDLLTRRYTSSEQPKLGLVVGAVQVEGCTNGQLTHGGKYVNDALKLELTKLMERSSFTAKPNETRLFYLDKLVCCVVGMGKHSVDENGNVDLEDKKDVVRRCAATGVRKLSGIVGKKEEMHIMVDDFEGHAQEASEGAHLGNYIFNHEECFSAETRNQKHKNIKMELLDVSKISNELNKEKSKSLESMLKDWERGRTAASWQNFARELAELPSNLLTPTKFCNRVKQAADDMKLDDNFQFIIRDKNWLKEQNMNLLLAVSQGSVEEPKLLEMIYEPSEGYHHTLILVGKGVTFDSGGISIKPSADMGMMRGDMGGAAAVVGATLALRDLKIAGLRVVGIAGLCENMPSGGAIKPADVIRSMSGKTVEIDNTDAEGRLVLADVLTYVCSAYAKQQQDDVNENNDKQDTASDSIPAEKKEVEPTVTVVDVATLTGAIDVALGGIVSGVFTKNERLWAQMEKSGKVTGDRMWRMPLMDEYKDQLKSRIADIKNVGGRSGGACTAAAFLKQFIAFPKSEQEATSEESGADIEDTSSKKATPQVRWAHVDIAGVAWTTSDKPHSSAGMTGRPTRALVELAHLISKK